MISSLARRLNNKEDVDLLMFLTRGCQLTLIDKKGEQKKRVIYVDDFTGVLRKISVGLLASDGTKPIISLFDVMNVIDASYADKLPHDCMYEAKDRSFSLSSRHNVKTLDFICHNSTTKWAFVRGLTLIVAKLNQSRLPPQSNAEEIACYNFYLSDTNRDDMLSIEEACDTVRRLNLELDESYLNFLLQNIKGTQKSKNPLHRNYLDRKEFLQLVRMVSNCPEIRLIFEQAKETGPYLGGMKFGAFLQRHQGQPSVTHTTIGTLIHRYELSFALRGTDNLSYEGFRAFLMSEDNSIQTPESLTDVYHDISKPMSDYWIYTSYLNLRSVDSFVAALREGCRCLDIVTYDGIDDEPLVANRVSYNPVAPNLKVTLRDVLYAIHDEAFVVSPFPVILSIENKCSITQQRRMVYHLRNILGDLLCTSAIALMLPGKLQSPEALKNKILLESKIPTDDFSAYFQPDMAGRAMANKVAKELADMTAFFALPLTLLDVLKKQRQHVPANRIVTLTETEAQHLIDNNPAMLNSLVSERLVRVTSVKGSPLPFLLAGCQLVNVSAETDLRHRSSFYGFFRDNGQCGYVLKAAPVPLPRHISTPPMIFQLQIISGYQLSSGTRDTAVVDPYVMLRIEGAYEDEANCQTTVVANNGFNPVWNEAFVFKAVRPDVALLNVVLMDGDKKQSGLVGQYTVPIRLCRPGFRVIRIDSGKARASALLVNMSIGSTTL